MKVEQIKHLYPKWAYLVKKPFCGISTHNLIWLILSLSASLSLLRMPMDLSVSLLYLHILNSFADSLLFKQLFIDGSLPEAKMKRERELLRVSHPEDITAIWLNDSRDWQILIVKRRDAEKQSVFARNQWNLENFVVRLRHRIATNFCKLVHDQMKFFSLSQMVQNQWWIEDFEEISDFWSRKFCMIELQWSGKMSSKRRNHDEKESNFDK